MYRIDLQTLVASYFSDQNATFTLYIEPIDNHLMTVIYHVEMRFCPQMIFMFMYKQSKRKQQVRVY